MEGDISNPLGEDKSGFQRFKEEVQKVFKIFIISDLLWNNLTAYKRG